MKGKIIFLMISFLCYYTNKEFNRFSKRDFRLQEMREEERTLEYLYKQEINTCDYRNRKNRDELNICLDEVQIKYYGKDGNKLKLKYNITSEDGILFNLWNTYYK
jgi:hypothetical protein